MNDSQAGTKTDDDPRTPFAVHNQLAINRYLMDSVDHADLYTISFHGKQMITCLLALDTKTNTLFFDTSQQASDNEALLASRRSRFRGLSGGVRVEFDLSLVKATKFEGRPAFATMIPPVLFYIQRREFFRVSTPMMNPYHCTGTMLLSHGGQSEYDIEIHDVSLSGIGLRSIEPVEVGAMMPKSKIDLREHGVLQTDLRVVNCKDIELANRKHINHIGCLFDRLSMAQEAMLQRYIMQAEKEQAMVKAKKD